MSSILPEIQLGFLDGIVLWLIIAVVLAGLLLLTTFGGMVLWVLIVVATGLVLWAVLKRLARWWEGGRRSPGTGGYDRGGGD